MNDDLALMSTENYESVFLSMHSPEYFTKEVFSTYLGQDTLVASHTLLNAREISMYLDSVFRSGNEISHVYMCLDPDLLWRSADQNSKAWEKELTNHLYSYIKKYPDVSFEILLPYPYIDYWLSMSEKNLDTTLSVYQALADELSAYPNAKAFFPGGEYWLMVNPDNYENSLFDANAIITQKIFLYTFCDQIFQITPTSEEKEFTDGFLEVISREKHNPTYYPDLSQWNLVFFGDSIFAMFPGSYSVPGYITGLANATTYNYSVGGSTASLRGEDGSDFPNVMDAFLADDGITPNGATIFCPDGMQDGGIASKKLCFLFQFGINDFYSNMPPANPADPFDINTYEGALRTCISRLQEKYPDACYILMSPTHVLSTEDVKFTLADYVEIMQKISGEMNLYFIDNYNDFVITEENMSEYLLDGCHPGPEARLAIASRIMYFIEENLN